MLELIIGAKGNGKTRKMVERANNESKRTSGSIITLIRATSICMNFLMSSGSSICTSTIFNPQMPLWALFRD